MKKINFYQVFLFVAVILFSSLSYSFDENPLPSWNQGAVKKHIIEFVQAVTDKNSPYYVPAEDRIATFDNDGTLWVEQPLYPQMLFMIDRFKAMSNKHPEWKVKEPYKTILSNNHKNLTNEHFYTLLTQTSGVMSVEEYQSLAKNWLNTAIHPKYKHHYPELVYQPMIEVMEFLRANDFKVYIVSGGGQDFIRTFAPEVYGVTSDKVIGSTTTTNYILKDNSPQLLKSQQLLILCDKEGKAEAIHLFIGKKPIISFGNSDGDKQMLEWTQSGQGKKLMLLVHHDDSDREYSYDTQSKVGTFSTELMKKAKENDWDVISMKKDWKILFPFEKAKA